MENPQPITCGIQRCNRPARSAAILGTQRFCIVPATSSVAVSPPLVRYNVCDQHLDSIRANFREVPCDEVGENYKNVSVFIERSPAHIRGVVSLIK